LLIKTRGIIFRAVKYSETSIIADIFTEEKGLRSYIISGVRKKKSRVSAGLLQVMSLVDMVAYFRADKDLHRIKEIKAAHIYTSLPFDVQKSAVGMFMAELAKKTIKESEENTALFEFLFRNFQFLDETKNSFANVHLHFMLGLSTYLGFLPGGEWKEETPYFDKQAGLFVSEQPLDIYGMNEEPSHLMMQLLKSPLEDCHQIKMDRIERQQLLKHLIDFYKLHIENFKDLNAHLILREVL